MKKLLLAALLALTPALAGAQATTKQGATYVDLEGLLPSYTAGFDVTGYTTPTDLFCVNGSATRVVKVRRITVTGQATSATQMDIVFLRRSTANTGGTPTSITLGYDDSLDPAPTATVTKYGAAPTLGAQFGGSVLDVQINFPAPGGGNPPLPAAWPPSSEGTKTLTLRGANEGVCWNWNGAAWPAGGDASITVEWTEE